MRSFFTTALLAATIAHVQAIKVSSPGKNDEVDISKGVEVKWSTVQSDPSTAHLVLVNKASGHTPFEKDLGEVDLSKGSIFIKEKDVPADGGFQFNFESVDELNTGILAQSEQFEIEKADESDDEDKTSSTTAKTTVKTTATTASTASTTAESSTAETTATETDATTLTKVTTSATGTETEAPKTSGTATESSTTSTSTGAAATQAVGGALALVAGILAVMA